MIFWLFGGINFSYAIFSVRGTELWYNISYWVAHAPQMGQKMKNTVTSISTPFFQVCSGMLIKVDIVLGLILLRVLRITTH